jgi:hypothetical protein
MKRTHFVQANEFVGRPSSPLTRMRKDWLSWQDMLMEQKPISGGSLEYADSVPQLGIEPFRFRDGLSCRSAPLGPSKR